MKKKIRQIDTTADLGIIISGDNLKELFLNAAIGLFELICDINKVEEKESYDVEVSASDLEGLLVAWLSELIFLFDAKGFLAARFEILKMDKLSIKAKVYGESIKEKHYLKNEVKAVTYHQLKIEKINEQWQVKLIFDV